MSLPERLAIDASVAIKWVVAERGSDRAALLLDRQLIAPDLICAECANILWKKVARKELTADQAALASEALEGAELELLGMRRHLAKATALAIKLDHPAYDCVYLVVAGSVGVPLVTADDRLAKKALQHRRHLETAVIHLSDI